MYAQARLSFPLLPMRRVTCIMGWITSATFQNHLASTCCIKRPAQLRRQVKFTDLYVVSLAIIMSKCVDHTSQTDICLRCVYISTKINQSVTVQV